MELEQEVGLREAVKELKKLLESAGWRYLSGMVQEQIQTRTPQVLYSACGSIGDCLKEQFVKGEIAGLQLVLTTAQASLESFEAQLKEEEESK